MKWVKLIGGRFLDFIIMGAVVTLLCVGIVLIGEHLGEYLIERITTLPSGELNWEKFRDPTPLDMRIAWAIRDVTRVLSIAIGLFGVISVLGIVFRREGLTQREGFVRVWVGVPKYFAGYLRKSNTKGE